MRVLLGQLAPVPADVLANLERLRSTVLQNPADLYVFPELFLSGYRIGDRFQHVALPRSGSELRSLGSLAKSRGVTIVVGAPVRHDRPGEVENAAVVASPSGLVSIHAKQFLPTYGPFEEGLTFTPGGRGAPVESGGHRLGLQICYDAFFPEVSRELAMQGIDLLLVLSAAPVTSRRLFDKVLPARAVENAVPLVYVNRVGVEDGVVFGGGSQALDARGEPLEAPGMPSDPNRSDEAVWTVEIDPTEAARWRPFRPVLRDVAPRRPVSSSPEAPPEGGDTAVPRHPSPRAARTHRL